MQRTPEFIKSVIMADKKSKSLHITLSVLKNTFGKDIITQTLIDCRASINCLNWGLVKQHKLPCYKLFQPIRAKNVDGPTMVQESSNSSQLYSFRSIE